MPVRIVYLQRANEVESSVTPPVCRIPWLALFVALVPAVLHGQDEGSERPDDAVAWQGGAVVTLGDIDARVARIPDDMRGGVMDSPQRIEEFVSGLLVNRQLAARARELGLHEDPAFEAELAIIGEEVLARRFLEHIVDEPSSADIEALAREQYLANRSRYSIAGGNRVSHVLVSTRDRNDAEARERAEEVLAKLQGGGLSFAEAVTAYSEDPSHRANQGAVGIVDDNLDPAFRTAAERLQRPGEYSEVVKSQFGYHVIRLDSIEEARELSFDDVRTALFARIRADRKARMRADAIEKVRALPLDADPDLVYSLRTRYRTGGVEEPPL